MSLPLTLADLLRSITDSSEKSTDLATLVHDQLLLYVFPPVSTSLMVQVWIQVAGQLLVAGLALAGIAARYRKGNGWTFVHDASTGTIRPNQAITTHALFAIYAVLFLIATPTYTVQRMPSTAGFLLQTLTFVPLGISFHLMTWSTALAPYTTFANLAAPVGHQRQQSVLRRYFKSIVAIVGLAAFLCSILPIAILLAHHREAFMHAVQQQLQKLDAVHQSGAGVVGVLQLLPGLQLLQARSTSVVFWFRFSIAVYLGWGLIWFTIFIPSSLRMITTLRSRRRRYSRAIKSLQLLSDIVTTDTKVDQAVPMLPPLAQTRSRSISTKLSKVHPFPPLSVPSPSPMQTPALLAHPSSASDGLPFLSEASGSLSNSTLRPPLTSATTGSSFIAKLAQARLFAEQLLEAVGFNDDLAPAKLATPPVYSFATLTRIEEARVMLVKTNRLLLSIAVQLVLTVSMVFSYLAFCCWILVLADFQNLAAVYAEWTGWTSVIPSLVSSTLFLLLSLRGPVASSPSVKARPREYTAAVSDEDSLWAPPHRVPPPPTQSPPASSPKSSRITRTMSLAKSTLGLQIRKGQPRPTLNASLAAAESDIPFHIPSQPWVPSTWASQERLKRQQNPSRMQQAENAV